MHKDLKILQQSLLGSLSALTRDQTQQRPAHRPEAWSIQQIVEHVLLTYERSSAVIEERIVKGQPTKKVATLPQRLGQFLVVHWGYFPRGRKAPTSVEPPHNPVPQSGDELGAAVQAGLANLEAIFNQCEQAFGQRRCATHAILGPMRIQQWRKFQLVHGMHHVKQIATIRNEMA